MFKAHFQHEKLDALQLDMEITAEEVNHLLQGFEIVTALYAFLPEQFHFR